MFILHCDLRSIFISPQRSGLFVSLVVCHISQVFQIFIFSFITAQRYVTEVGKGDLRKRIFRFIQIELSYQEGVNTRSMRDNY